MAEPPKGRSHEDFAERARFVRELVKDPSNVPNVMRLYGYLGDSSEDGHDRLYLDADLAAYVEIPRSAILSRASIPESQDPYLAVVLWVRRDTALKYKSSAGANALAHYFAGTLQGAAEGWAGARLRHQNLITVPICTIDLLCPTHMDVCVPRASAGCSVACPTAGCSAVCPPTPGCSVACPTPDCSVAGCNYPQWTHNVQACHTYVPQCARTGYNCR